MTDFLKKFCDMTNIELIYTSNKYKVCSMNVCDGTPKLRVHRIFKNCSEDAANAVISYFVKFEDLDNARNIIEEYLYENYPIEEFYIESPNEDVKFQFINSIEPSFPSNEQDKVPKELNILSISKSDMNGNTSTVSPEDSIMVNQGDLLEVNITVGMFD